MFRSFPSQIKTSLFVPTPTTSLPQTLAYRFQQIECPVTADKCAVRGKPQYYDTYWWSTAPDGNTAETGPAQPAAAAGFYTNLYGRFNAPVASGQPVLRTITPVL